MALVIFGAGFQTGVIESETDFVCRNKLGRSPLPFFDTG
jgi:hypothetical protein